MLRHDIYNKTFRGFFCLPPITCVFIQREDHLVYLHTSSNVDLHPGGHIVPELYQSSTYFVAESDATGCGRRVRRRRGANRISRNTSALQPSFETQERRGVKTDSRVKVGPSRSPLSESCVSSRGERSPEELSSG